MRDSADKPNSLKQRRLDTVEHAWELHSQQLLGSIGGAVATHRRTHVQLSVLFTIYRTALHVIDQDVLDRMDASNMTRLVE